MHSSKNANHHCLRNAGRVTQNYLRNNCCWKCQEKWRCRFSDEPNCHSCLWQMPGRSSMRFDSWLPRLCPPACANVWNTSRSHAKCRLPSNCAAARWSLGDQGAILPAVWWRRFRNFWISRDCSETQRAIQWVQSPFVNSCSFCPSCWTTNRNLCCGRDFWALDSREAGQHELVEASAKKLTWNLIFANDIYATLISHPSV